MHPVHKPPRAQEESSSSMPVIVNEMIEKYWQPYEPSHSFFQALRIDLVCFIPSYSCSNLHFPSTEREHSSNNITIARSHRIGYVRISTRNWYISFISLDAAYASGFSNCQCKRMVSQSTIQPAKTIRNK